MSTSLESAGDRARHDGDPHLFGPGARQKFANGDATASRPRPPCPLCGGAERANAIREVAVVLNPHATAEAGIVGYASLVVEATFRIDSIQIRRTADGMLLIRFPEHRDRRGRGHPVVLPSDPATLAAMRTAIRTQFFAVLASAGLQARFDRQSDAPSPPEVIR
jgi:hypothetical protein